MKLTPFSFHFHGNAGKVVKPEPKTEEPAPKPKWVVQTQDKPGA